MGAVMGTVRRLWATHPRLLLAFVAATALALFFAVRILVATIYWAEHRNEAVQPWMTVGYVGRSWGLDPREIDAAAGLPAPDGHPLTLDEIARQRGVPVAEVIAQVQAAMDAMRAAQKPEAQPEPRPAPQPEPQPLPRPAP